MIKVTREEMKAIEEIKQWSTYTTEKILSVIGDKNDKFWGIYEPLNDMSTEQIVLAWHGHVEVEPEYISFNEAMGFLKCGKKVKAHYGVGKGFDIIHIHNPLDKFTGVHFKDLLNSKFTIVDEN